MISSQGYLSINRRGRVSLFSLMACFEIWCKSIICVIWKMPKKVMVLLVCLRKIYSENIIHQKTPTVNKVFLSLRKLSLDLMPDIQPNQQKLSQSQDSRFRLEHLTVNWHMRLPRKLTCYIENPAFEYYFPIEHGGFFFNATFQGCELSNVWTLGLFQKCKEALHPNVPNMKPYRVSYPTIRCLVDKDFHTGIQSSIKKNTY